MIKYFCDCCENNITENRGYYIAFTENGKREEYNVCEECFNKAKDAIFPNRGEISG